MRCRAWLSNNKHQQFKANDWNVQIYIRQFKSLLYHEFQLVCVCVLNTLFSFVPQFKMKWFFYLILFILIHLRSMCPGQVVEWNDHCSKWYLVLAMPLFTEFYCFMENYWTICTKYPRVCVLCERIVSTESRVQHIKRIIRQIQMHCNECEHETGEMNYRCVVVDRVLRVTYDFWFPFQINAITNSLYHQFISGCLSFEWLQSIFCLIHILINSMDNDYYPV